MGPLLNFLSDDGTGKDRKFSPAFRLLNRFFDIVHEALSGANKRTPPTELNNVVKQNKSTENRHRSHYLKTIQKTLLKTRNGGTYNKRENRLRYGH